MSETARTPSVYYSHTAVLRILRKAPPRRSAPRLYSPRGSSETSSKSTYNSVQRSTQVQTIHSRDGQQAPCFVLLRTELTEMGKSRGRDADAACWRLGVRSCLGQRRRRYLNRSQHTVNSRGGHRAARGPDTARTRSVRPAAGDIWQGGR